MCKFKRDMPVLVSESNPINMNFGDDYPLDLSDGTDSEIYLDINPDFPVVISAKIDNEYCTLEMYMYDEKESNLILHHDIILSNFPVCLEWLGVDPGSIVEENAIFGNFAIVGLMSNDIEIWDLNAYEPPGPYSVLAGKNGHKDAVTGLNIHPLRGNVLATSSADCTVKIWDLEKNVNIFTYCDNKEKVHGVVWDPQQDSSLISFSMDGLIKHFDARNNKSVRSIQTKIGCDIEVLTVNSNRIFAGYENGMLEEFSMYTMANKCVKRIQPHQNAIMGLLCTQDNFLITNDVQGHMKVSNLENLKQIAEENTKEEQLYSSSVCPDNQNLIAFGSSKGEIVIWDIMESTKNLRL